MFKLYDHQQKCVNEVRQQIKNGSKSVLLQAATGGGKCLGRDTLVLLYNGKTKKVQDVVPGDKLMGHDSCPRTVESVCSGRENLYKIKPKKGEPWVCNESHILSLKRTNATESRGCAGYETRSKPKGHLQNVSVKDYLNKSNSFKHKYKQWRTGVDFSNARKRFNLSPYFIGLWLGDGTSRNSSITSEDQECVASYYEEAHKHNLFVRKEKSNSSANLYISTKLMRSKDDNPMTTGLRKLNLLQNKHIPHCYLTATRENRLELLAGLIDSDGSLGNGTYDFISKFERLSDDIIYLSRSLGLAAYKTECTKSHDKGKTNGTYYRVSISGEISIVPCRIKRKIAADRRQKKDVLVTGFDIEKMGVGDYYGFEISGNDRLFMLGDFTVTHNTIMAGDFVKGAVKKGNKVWFTVPRKQLLLQMANTFDEFDIDYGVIAAGHKADYNKQVQICSMQSLTNRLHLVTPPDVCIIDEAHYAAAQMDEFIQWLKARGVVIVGLTATPWRLDGKPMGMWYASMVQGETIANLIKGGHLSDYRLFHGAKVDGSGVRKSGGEYVIRDLEDLLWHDKKRISNIAAGYKQHAMGLRTIAYGVSVADCERIAEQLRGEGIEAYAISGKTADDERKRMINDFADGKINILVNCDLLTFGFDLSSQVGRDVPIEAMIDAAPTMSLSKQLQKNGRALRKKEQPAIILDYVGNMLPHNHGLPDDDREWSLLGREVKSGGSKERTIPVRQCEKCDFCFPPQPACPYCGHVQSVDERQIDEVDAIMAEVDKEVMREAAKNKRMEVGKAKTLADLRQIARERNYNPSWVYIRAKLKGIKA